MDKKIAIPEEMIEAALEALRVAWGYSKEVTRSILDSHRKSASITIEAALRWLSENPIVPTIRQANDLYQHTLITSTTVHHVRRITEEWQRIMFFAPEPEFTEAIKDLLYDDLSGERSIDFYNKAIEEAFRRGQKSMEGK